jgi:5,6-dimethylbenzimidazole synthase
MTEPAQKTDIPARPLGTPTFDADFLDRLEDLIHWRRDVRRFPPDPVDDALVTRLIDLAALAPSVGNSQPWRFVTVAEPARRKRVIENFEACNADALKDYEGERAKLYASLKLAGLREAPVHLAVFCDTETQAGRGLGRKTMPEMLHYSVVGAISTLWLAARAHGLGMGWVSIVEPEVIGEILDVPLGWALIAYLCIGWPVEEHLDPELERAGWQQRLDTETFITRR